MHLVEVAPLLFRNVAGPELVAFRQDQAGRITHLFDEEPMIAYERQPWYRNTRLHLGILGGSAALFLVILGRAFVRRREPIPASAVLGRRLLLGAALAYLAFVAAAVWLGSDFIGLIFGDSNRKLQAALTLPVVGAVLTLGAAVSAAQQWRNGVGTVSSRLRFSALVGVALLFAWSLNEWNLLGWKL